MLQRGLEHSIWVLECSIELYGVLLGVVEILRVLWGQVCLDWSVGMFWEADICCF